MLVEFEVPGPPRSWKRRRTGLGKSYNDPEYTAHKRNVGWLMLGAATAAQRTVMLQSKLSLQVDMFFATYRVQDADRVLNLILDAGKGLFWKDDTWTTFDGGEIVLRPSLDRSNPRVVVRVEVRPPTAG